jgi:hypothetical protein
MGGQVFKDGKIIQEKFHEIVQVLLERPIHRLLVGRGCILEYGGHHHPHKGPLIHNEGHFLIVIKSYLNLVVAQKSIQK